MINLFECTPIPHFENNVIDSSGNVYNIKNERKLTPYKDKDNRIYYKLHNKNGIHRVFVDELSTNISLTDNSIDKEDNIIKGTESELSFKYSLEENVPFRDLGEMFNKDVQFQELGELKKEEPNGPIIEDLLCLSVEKEIEFDNMEMNERLTFGNIQLGKQNKRSIQNKIAIKKHGIEKIKKDIIKNFDRYDFENIEYFTEYTINIHGQIKKFDRNKLIDISYSKTNDKYAVVSLFLNGEKYKCSVANLVVETFIPALIGKNYRLFYINKNKNDNFIGNLRIII